MKVSREIAGLIPHNYGDASMTENGCPCKGWKSGLLHAGALFAVIFLAVVAANCATRACPWLNGQGGQTPPAAVQIK